MEVGDIPDDADVSKNIGPPVFPVPCGAVSPGTGEVVVFLAIFNSSLLWLELLPEGSSLAQEC